MANTSILTAFERMWQHIVAVVGQKADADHTHNAAGEELGFVQSGGDVSISNGIITVNDDSHNHTIENIDNLQAALDMKADTNHTHNVVVISRW